MCRLTHSLVTGKFSSKRVATAWACTQFPEPWRSVVVASEQWVGDPRQDEDVNHSVQRLIAWLGANYEEQVGLWDQVVDA